MQIMNHGTTDRELTNLFDDRLACAGNSFLFFFRTDVIGIKITFSNECQFSVT